MSGRASTTLETTARGIAEDGILANAESGTQVTADMTAVNAAAVNAASVAKVAVNATTAAAH